MTALIYLIILLCGLPTLLLSFDFLSFVFTKRRLYNKIQYGIIEVAGMIALPLLYLLLFDESTNDCCGDSATFSPEHKLTIYVLISVSIITYFYSSYKRNSSTPVIEVLTNSILLLGLVLNIFIAIHIGGILWLWGNIPVGLLFMFRLIGNHKIFIESNKVNQYEPENYFEKIAWKILNLNPFIKIPFLLVLCLPVLTIISSLLILFGQKADSIVRAFTDTYKHGFSQLNYMCYNVECGEHFLCSVAANGHKKVVSPIRYGERNGSKIICNRQLLISNAFEELIQQNLPKTHRIIRSKYNKIGKLIHKHYHIFNNKFVSDIIYIIMKPLEMFFLVILYTFDRKPENRIAKQYLNKKDIKILN